MSKNTDKLNTIIATIPGKPGVYQYYNDEGVIIYVGKAKNLKKRVSSYFTSSHQSGKLRLLVSKIRDIKTIITNSEIDALLLENNLIKKYQPRYNIQLKDDKTFPWLCIKKEPFPRVFSIRQIINDGSEYFGPYASMRMMKTVLDTIKQLYTLRTCSLNLSQKKIALQKYKVCLEYHLGNCKAPCIAEQSEEDYNEIISQIRSILKGNTSSVISELQSLMIVKAENMDFEQAQVIKEKIEILEKYKSKSTIVNPSIHNVDVVSIMVSENNAYLNFLKVVNGSVIQAHTVEIKKKLEEKDIDILTFALLDFRKRFKSESKEVILPIMPEVEIPGVKITVPVRGDKKHLLELSERNAKQVMIDKRKQKDLVDPDRHKNRILARMKKDLRMNVEPRVIECFDNSNFQGAFPVAAMVQFVDTVPHKKAYRHFNIKTVEGSNDFASMEEVVKRRYSRLLAEEKELPQLIIVDGGKGQLSSAVSALKQINLYGKIAVIGIAKRLEEIYFPEDPVPLYIDKTSETLKVVQRLRDEAHRFGITHHRKKRDAGTIKTDLTSITGIGENTAKLLLSKFKSVKRIKETSFDDLVKVIGNAKANIIVKHYSNNKK